LIYWVIESLTNESIPSAKHPNSLVAFAVLSDLTAIKIGSPASAPTISGRVRRFRRPQQMRDWQALRRRAPAGNVQTDQPLSQPPFACVQAAVVLNDTLIFRRGTIEVREPPSAPTRA
jgi:hypothetical protein